MNLPNTLSLSRIFLTPVLVVILLTRVEGKELYGAIIFAIAALTDFFDGYFARRRNQVTTVGKLLDPIADKLLTCSAFISLVELNLAPAWMVVLIVGREFAVSGIRSIASSRGYLMPANWLGKTKMVIQILTIVVLIISDGKVPYKEQWSNAGVLLLWTTVAVSVLSAGTYLAQFLRLINLPARIQLTEDHGQEGRKEKII